QRRVHPADELVDLDLTAVVGVERETLADLSGAERDVHTDDQFVDRDVAAVVAVADASAAGAAGRSRRRAGRFARHAEGTVDLIDGFAAARWSALVEVVAGVTDVGRLARAGFRIASFASGIALDGVAFALTGVDITGVIAQIAVGVGTLFEFREAKGLVQRRK